ncbi:MAG: Gfo/Idh/MocA family oxidoreductase [Actinomycetota bacterium]|nr:Gfo/Idh/MocA family oxidoreductase [Actinomycetota bacterium]
MNRGRPGSGPLRTGLIGAGRMGSFHAATLATRLDCTELVAIADVDEERAASLAGDLGVPRVYADAEDLLADGQVEAVVIAAPARAHAALVLGALEAGKAVFCEKPMAVTSEEAEQVVRAARGSRLAVQVGFNRRFAPDFVAAREAAANGELGSVHLLRSLTRDPGLAAPERVPAWTIFLETLIHDFDMLAFLNPGASAVEVFALADALVAPAYKEHGLLDTAMVTVRFSNGALAVAEASFRAVYGYDVRAEVFGSGGMVTAGAPQRGAAVRYSAAGALQETVRADTELFADAYVAELSAFAAAVQGGAAPAVGPADAQAALGIALACVESVRRHAPVRVAGDRAFTGPGAAEGSEVMTLTP